MTLETVNIGLLGENCYLLSTEKAAVIIDPGMADTRVLEFLEENKGKQIAVLLTHCHFDHIGGVEKICSLFKAKVIIGEKEADGLNDPDVNLSHRFHYRLGKIIPDMLLSDGEKFSVGDSQDSPGGEAKTPLSSQVATRISWSPLSGLKGAWRPDFSGAAREAP